MKTTIGALKSTCDRKTKFHDTQRNTFGLLPGLEGSCPGATTAPGGCWHIPEGRKLPECYVARTMSAYKAVRGVLEHNTRLLAAARLWEKIELLDDEFARFRAAELRREQAGHAKKMTYRLHWSGDIFDDEYAKALASAIQLNSDINFWCYTRTFSAVPALCNIPNLILYLSLDPVNVQQGLSVFADNKNNQNNLQICYMSTENNFDTHLERAAQILTIRNNDHEPPGLGWVTDKWPLRACPVDIGKMKLEGGCAKCKQCISIGREPTPVWFKA